MSSEIAKALAKAKEHIGHPSNLETAAFRQSKLAAKNTKRFWIILTALAFPATAILLWTRLGSPSVASVHPAEPAAVQPAPSEVTHPPAASVTPPPEVVLPPSTELAESGDRKPELINVIASWTISAVIQGTPARIVVNNRIIRVGEAVDDQLTFIGISKGNLFFMDQNSATYCRRY